ncbi:zinc finger protein 862-like [Rhizophagus clarus]|uniref:Zinc finger protein 862-like n=1 Tax=Rhizophagus clarus TaxID=94130 RepID=A0A8H3LR81_9GLOM|nr:zinc finger protein 862-like [Rhizophagus clarus]
MLFASDSTSVMLGNLTGVALRIKERNIITHCIAHRLTLACNLAEKHVLFCKHVEFIMKSIYNFFSNFSKRIDTLHKYQEILDHPILRIKQIYEIKWFSWYEAVKNLCLSIKPLMDTLLEMITTITNNHQRHNFISLYTAICDWKFLAFLHFLWDILRYLSILKNCIIGAHQLMCNEDSEAELIADIQSFASAVILEIQERFPNRPLLNSIKIFDHINWPNNKEELTRYGENKLNILAEFYRKKQIIEVDNICEEWFGYKAIVYVNFKNIEIKLLIPRLFEFYHDTFPNIIKLLGIIYSIPFSTVEYEHGFSKQNLIKTDLQNSLNIEMLHFIMMVGLEEKNLLEFNFTRALQIWRSSKAGPWFRWMGTASASGKLGR